MPSSKLSLTLILLCLGYCIDFYDLTLMSVSYPTLIPQKFHLSNVIDIQRTYLLISNFQTLGILIGAFIFGLLGDKIGRAASIKYSILLYSITTLLAVYTDSLPLFIICRLLAYIGLATEFSTSTVLIYELFNFKSAAWGTAILYIFGVCGGLAATSMSFISWQATFLLGGFAGLLLYCVRSVITESHLFLDYKKSTLKLEILKTLFGDAAHRKLLLRYFLMITPYSVLISLMFIFPNYIIENHTLDSATRLLLLGFFIGNMISSVLSPFFLRYRKQFMLSVLVLFCCLMLVYPFVPESWLFVYSCGLGLCGGGYPVVWAQQVASEFPIAVRSMASNTLFALGRATGIVLNILISTWILIPERFVQNAAVLVVFVFVIAVVCVSRTQRWVDTESRV